MTPKLVEINIILWQVTKSFFYDIFEQSRATAEKKKVHKMKSPLLGPKHRLRSRPVME